MGVELKSRLVQVEALGSGRVVFVWGPSGISVGSFVIFQVDLFYLFILFIYFIYFIFSAHFVQCSFYVHSV